MRRSDPFRDPSATSADARLEALLRYAIAIGAVLVLLLPAARGSHAALGWLPLWLLLMPMTAWWALHRFALPAWAPGRRVAAARPRPRAVVQARRRTRPARPLALPRAA